jgi:hypothetical protein
MVGYANQLPSLRTFAGSCQAAVFVGSLKKGVLARRQVLRGQNDLFLTRIKASSSGFSFHGGESTRRREVLARVRTNKCGNL